MSLLVLGGTNDALLLANSLHQKGVSVIYSLAGLVRVPTVDYKVITGGFSQYGGLNSYINTSENAIAGILDATHPYANSISDTAHQAAIKNSIPYWQFDRPAWVKQAADNWFEYNNWGQLCSMLGDKKSIFITTGQLDPITLDTVSKKLAAKILIRTAIKPTAKSQANVRWIQAIGPFTLEGEIALMQEYAVDALISKNSGGNATMAKLHAAKKLQVPVYLLKRPEYQRCQNDEPNTKIVFSNVAACEDAVLAHFS